MFATTNVFGPILLLHASKCFSGEVSYHTSYGETSFCTPPTLKLQKHDEAVADKTPRPWPHPG